jgi:hypothetical protein
MYINDYIVKEHQNELLKEAEYYRMISLAKHHQVNTSQYFTKSLAWLGKRMCSWGSLLESRFGGQSTLPHSQSIDRRVKA